MDARLSRTSDRFPPASFWVRTAVTKNRASRHCTRSAKFRSAWDSGSPKFCWSYSIWNSGPIGFGQFLCHHREPGRQCMSGPQGTRQQIDRFGKLFLEFQQASRARVADVCEGKARRDRADHTGDEQQMQEPVDEEEAERRRASRGEDDDAERDLQPRLIDGALQRCGDSAPSVRAGSRADGRSLSRSGAFSRASVIRDLCCPTNPRTDGGSFGRLGPNDEQPVAAEDDPENNAKRC